MIRSQPLNSLASCWIPLAIITAMALLAVVVNELPPMVFWSLTLFFIAAICLWKLAVRRQVCSLLTPGPLDSVQLASVQNGFYVYMGIYLLIQLSLLTLFAFAWWYQHVFSWAVVMPLAAAWFIRKDIWATIVGRAVNESLMPGGRKS